MSYNTQGLCLILRNIHASRCTSFPIVCPEFCQINFVSFCLSLFKCFFNYGKILQLRSLDKMSSLLFSIKQSNLYSPKKFHKFMKQFKDMFVYHYFVKNPVYMHDFFHNLFNDFAKITPRC